MLSCLKLEKTFLLVYFTFLPYLSHVWEFFPRANDKWNKFCFFFIFNFCLKSRSCCSILVRISRYSALSFFLREITPLKHMQSHHTIHGEWQFAFWDPLLDLIGTIFFSSYKRFSFPRAHWSKQTLPLGLFDLLLRLYIEVIEFLGNTVLSKTEVANCHY